MTRASGRGACMQVADQRGQPREVEGHRHGDADDVRDRGSSARSAVAAAGAALTRVRHAPPVDLQQVGDDPRPQPVTLARRAGDERSTLGATSSATCGTADVHDPGHDLTRAVFLRDGQLAGLPQPADLVHRRSHGLCVQLPQRQGVRGEPLGEQQGRQLVTPDETSTSSARTSLHAAEPAGTGLAPSLGQPDPLFVLIAHPSVELADRAGLVDRAGAGPTPAAVHRP